MKEVQTKIVTLKEVQTKMHSIVNFLKSSKPLLEDDRERFFKVRDDVRDVVLSIVSHGWYIKALPFGIWKSCTLGIALANGRLELKTRV